MTEGAPSEGFRRDVHLDEGQVATFQQLSHLSIRLVPQHLKHPRSAEPSRPFFEPTRNLTLGAPNAYDAVQKA